MNRFSFRWPMAGVLAGALALVLATGPVLAQNDDDDDAPGAKKEIRIYRGDGDGTQAPGAYLGVRVQDISRDLQKSRNLPNTQGALVNRVERGSPADDAGLRRGDVIVRLDGDEIEDSGELIQRMRGLDPGATVSVVVLRDGQRKTFQVKLEKRPPDAFGNLPRAYYHGMGDMQDWQDLGNQWEQMQTNRAELQRELRDIENSLQKLEDEVRALREEMRARNGERNRTD